MEDEFKSDKELEALVSDLRDHSKQEIAIAIMARDVHYMRRSLNKIENAYERGTYFKTEDFHNFRETEYGKFKIDMEKRMRSSELKTKGILTWGTAGMVALGIVQFVLPLIIK